MRGVSEAALVLYALCGAITPATAGPTRTRCRCTLVSNAAPLPATPDAHWTPLDPAPSPISLDSCARLGLQLETWQTERPSRFKAYMSSAIRLAKTETEEEQPLATTVLLNVGARQGAQTGGSGQHAKEREPRPTTRPRQRIECSAEEDPFSEYQGSCITLWTLHCLIAIVILACIGELMHIGMRWVNQRTDAQSEDISEKPALRLLGAERLLLAIPNPNAEAEMLRSPGAEKKIRATRNFVALIPSGRKEFVAYEDDEDDEMRRPVM